MANSLAQSILYPCFIQSWRVQTCLFTLFNPCSATPDNFTSFRSSPIRCPTFSTYKQISQEIFPIILAAGTKFHRTILTMLVSPFLPEPYQTLQQKQWPDEYPLHNIYFVVLYSYFFYPS